MFTSTATALNIFREVRFLFRFALYKQKVFTLKSFLSASKTPQPISAFFCLPDIL